MDRDDIARKDRRVARAMHIVLQDLTVRHPRSYVAQAASVEPTYFSKRFRDVAGISFKHWNMLVRVEAAQVLLETTDRQVRDVAAAVGYTDLTTFGRVFRKIAGMSPRQFRWKKFTNAPNAERSTLNAERSTPNADRAP